MFLGSTCGRLLEDVEEDNMDSLPSNFSNPDCGSNMDSDNDALPKAFYNFLQLRGFGSPAAFGTWMHLKILKTKTTTYLACYLRISKPTLYKYMWLVDLNWRGNSYIVACELATSKKSHAIFNTYAQAVRRFARPKHIRSDNAPEHNEVKRDMVRCWGPTARSFICGTSTCNQHIKHLWRELFERVLWFYKHLFESMEDIGILDKFHIGLQLGTPMRSVCINVVITLDHLIFLQTYFNRWNESLGLCRLLVEKILKTFLDHFSPMSKVQLCQRHFMHREGLNLDKQYLLHLDLTMECAMADVIGVDLPLYIESALPTAIPMKQGVLEKL
ncbi:hypothetical protein SELMODRAFT_404837 [Selaginella moellendorffii]|uniref:Integrase core domain-containing protein n=1 Tax=Selaginella moellendorffii TaxID=88036 RepID=D8QXI6_SELML|nr:hypothetical protein SELMODRAFT_404837 [Selaginella moellendorffii]